MCWSLVCSRVIGMLFGVVLLFRLLMFLFCFCCYVGLCGLVVF